MNNLPLTHMTAYAELLERCQYAAFEEAFADDGVFTPKTVKGRRYWYFQTTNKTGGRKQRYVGPETPELLDRIKEHKAAKSEVRERRSIVSMLVRNAYLPRPRSDIGDVLKALANDGVFRHRAVLVGTVAYQTYSAMLGVRLPRTTTQTDDVDIAQFQAISIAIDETAPPILETLKSVDSSFDAVPHTHDARRSTTYTSKTGLRIDLLAPNRGPNRDAPMDLPALGTDAEPLRYLDFLIHDEEPAIVLHGDGVLVNVPAPARFALHKLMVSTLRLSSSPKIEKDIFQAATLLDALVQKKNNDLKTLWDEAFDRGAQWQKNLLAGLRALPSGARDRALKAIYKPRKIVPNLTLAFNAPPARYNSHRQIIEFTGIAAGASVNCAITREAIDDHFGDSPDEKARMDLFYRNRDTIERLCRLKYLEFPVEEPDTVLLKSEDFDILYTP